MIIRACILSVVALQCFATSACKAEEQRIENTINIRILPGLAGDFHTFLEALSLLVIRNPISLDFPTENEIQTLSFVSIDGFPGDPVMIHLSPDLVAIGSGASRQLLTIDELRQNLELLAESASKAKSPGFVLLVSDKNVSSEFGMSILGVIAESGITSVMLARPTDTDAASSESHAKPSPPTDSTKKQNKPDMATPRKSPD
jgi:biopolymer transport protein ExbD